MLAGFIVRQENISYDLVVSSVKSSMCNDAVPFRVSIKGIVNRFDIPRFAGREVATEICSRLIAGLI